MTKTLIRIRETGARFLKDSRANISALMVLTLMPVIGAVGVGAEASNWFLTQRAIQNAADAAAIAAATNGCDPADTCKTTSLQASYSEEARATATKFGFLHNGGDTVVTPSNSAACRSPATGTCYEVAITRKVPFYLLNILGYTGNTTTTAGSRAQSVSAVAQAKRFPGSAYCITALGTPNDAIRLNGTPSASFENCDAFVPNGGARCNGTNAQGAFRTAYMTNPHHSQACPSNSNQADAYADNFASLASNIPATPASCGATNSRSGSVIALSALAAGTNCKWGNVELTQNLSVGTASTLIIYDGKLDMNGYNLTTTGSGSLTIVFADGPGTVNNTTYAVTGPNGKASTLDIRAPTSGTWSGIAIYQDPGISTSGSNNLDFDYQSKKIDVKFSGLFYAPRAYFNTNGNSWLTYASNGGECLVMIVDEFQLSGNVTASTTGCTAAGLTNLPRAYNLINLVA